MATEPIQEVPRSGQSGAKKTARKPAAKRAKAKSGPKPKARRRQTTPAERAKILAAAAREGLTALDVQKHFGVVPVTYYSWRKKVGLKGPRGRKPAHVPGAGRGAGALAGFDVAGQVRQALRAEIARLLPAMSRMRSRTRSGE